MIPILIVYPPLRFAVAQLLTRDGSTPSLLRGDDLAPGNVQQYPLSSKRPKEIFPLTYRIFLAALLRGKPSKRRNAPFARQSKFHLEGLREDGAPIPPATSRVDYVEVAAWADDVYRTVALARLSD
jgi:hypothetical protein